MGRGSDVELENISGAVTVNGSYSGDLEFKNLTQPLHFQSRNTDLLVTRLPGQIRMDLGKLTATDVVGPMRLTTRSRDVVVEQFTQSLELDLERGDIELRPKQAQMPRISAKLASGDIELALPAAARFNLKASTERGEAENEFGPPLKLESRDHGASVNGTVGQGPDLTLVTRRGSLRVTKE